MQNSVYTYENGLRCHFRWGKNLFTVRVIRESDLHQEVHENALTLMFAKKKCSDLKSRIKS